MENLNNIHLYSKIQKPVAKNALMRKRLLDRINAADESKIIWITATAGSGKTTLISSYIEYYKIPHIWYNFDIRDETPETFFSYLVSAVFNFTNGVIKLPYLTTDYTDHIKFTLNFFESLYGTFNENSVLVFDDFQKVKNKNIHVLLNEGFSIIPNGIKIIVGSRTKIPEEYVRLHANGSIKEIEWEEIAFNMSETTELIKKSVSKLPENIDIKSVCNFTNGWAVCLVFLSKNFKQYKAFENTLYNYTKEDIFNYLSKEVFEESDSDIKYLLLKTVFFPEIKLEMVKEITGRKDLTELFKTLIRKYFFVIKHIENEAIYQYHDLFIDFLKKEAVTLPLDEYKDIRFKSALTLQKYGYEDLAAELFIEGNHWNELSQLIINKAPQFILQGRGKVVLQWLDSLDENFINSNPRLLFWKGICFVNINPVDARNFFEHAYKMFKIQNDMEGTFLTWTKIIETFAYDWNDFSPLGYWIEEFDQITESKQGYPSVEIEERVVACLFFALLFYQPGNSRMPYLAQRVNDIIYSSNSTEIKILLGYNYVYYLLWNCKTNKASEIINFLKPLYMNPSTNPLLQIMCLDMESVFYIYRCNPNKIIECANEALKISEKTGIHTWYLTTYGEMVFGMLFLNNTTKAQEYLTKMRIVSGNYQAYGKIFLNYFSAIVACTKKHLESALEYAQLCIRYTEQANSPMLSIHNTYPLIVIYIEYGFYDKARAEMEKIAVIGRAAGTNIGDYICSLMEAFIALKNNDDQNFSIFFSKAIALIKDDGIMFILHNYDVNFAICKKALQLGIEPEYVRLIAREFDFSADESCIEIENWPWFLKIYTLGEFRIEINNKPIKFTGKPQHKPLDMLKALIAFGCKYVSNETIEDTLWHDADGDTAHISFRTTLHRLRNLFSIEKDIFDYQDGKLSLDLSRCWVDVAALNYINDKTRDVMRNKDSKNIDEVFNLFCKMKKIYQGDFLISEKPALWIVPFRKEIKEMFVRFCMNTGIYFKYFKRFDLAVQCFREVIEKDIFYVESYKHLITCYREIGDLTKALIVESQLKEILRRNAQT
ncbi:MAG: hypothetical protein H7844_11955 [Nitrospirae bacterium YQR-1]